MTHDDDGYPDNPEEQPAKYGANPFERPRRQEPAFSDFEEDEDHPYEETDRDTDHTSGFREDNLEDEAFDDYLGEDTDEEDEFLDQTMSEELEPRSAPQWEERPAMAAEPSEAWLEEEQYPADDQHDGHQPWPLGLIAVGALALVLLVAGSYGVMQQRAATQEEIRSLQAALATAASPEDVNASRTAAREAKRESARLASQADALRSENRRLLDTVAGLEAQLDAQRETQGTGLPEPSVSATPAKPKAAEPQAAAPKTEAPKTAKPAAVAPAATTAATGAPTWFVNFGSYGQRDAAQAWQDRLKPESGKVIIAPSTKDGKTFYRVRVIDIASRESAEKIARSLEREYDLAKLWIGKQ